MLVVFGGLPGTGKTTISRAFVARRPDIEGPVLPTWQAVLDRRCDACLEPHLIIDTAHLTPDEEVAVIEHQLDADPETGL